MKLQLPWSRPGFLSYQLQSAPVIDFRSGLSCVIKHYNGTSPMIVEDRRLFSQLLENRLKLVVLHHWIGLQYLVKENRWSEKCNATSCSCVPVSGFKRLFPTHPRHLVKHGSGKKHVCRQHLHTWYVSCLWKPTTLKPLTYLAQHSAQTPCLWGQGSQWPAD